MDYIICNLTLEQIFYWVFIPLVVTDLIVTLLRKWVVKHPFSDCFLRFCVVRLLHKLGIIRYKQLLRITRSKKSTDTPKSDIQCTVSATQISMDFDVHKFGVDILSTEGLKNHTIDFVQESDSSMDGCFKGNEKKIYVYSSMNDTQFYKLDVLTHEIGHAVQYNKNPIYKNQAALTKVFDFWLFIYLYVGCTYISFVNSLGYVAVFSILIFVMYLIIPMYGEVFAEKYKRKVLYDAGYIISPVSTYNTFMRELGRVFKEWWGSYGIYCIVRWAIILIWCAVLWQLSHNWIALLFV